MTAREPDLVAAGAAWSAAAQMNPFETVMWRSEADPRLRSTVTLVEILDRAPDADRLLRAHDWASRIVPRFRQRVVEPPLTLGAPEWVTHGDIVFAYHLQHMHLTAPGSRVNVFEIAQAVAMRPFDRARPLWEAVVIDGLEGGRAAYILKAHHVLTDGIGGVQLLSMLHSRSRAPTRDRPEPLAPPADTRTTVEILAGQGAPAGGRGHQAEAIRQLDRRRRVRRPGRSAHRGACPDRRCSRSRPRCGASPARRLEHLRRCCARGAWSGGSRRPMVPLADLEGGRQIGRGVGQRCVRGCGARRVPPLSRALRRAHRHHADRDADQPAHGRGPPSGMGNRFMLGMRGSPRPSPSLIPAERMRCRCGSS